MASSADYLVPTTASFHEIYPEEALQAQRARWNALLSTFQNAYGAAPAFVSRSPGRVNIIGEHIDYSLFECLPMAVTADVLLAVTPSTEPRVRIANTQPAKFPTREFPLPADGSPPPIDAAAHDWSNYLRAGMKGAHAYLAARGQGGAPAAVGLDVVMDGSVPAGGGLSSSAAFVCAAALATVRAHGVKEVDKTALCELAIVSERAVGVNSGGMDQAASVFPRRGEGLLITFKPKLKTTPITIPSAVPGSNLAFVIAQTFVTSNKRVTGPVNYNLRVVECTLAALFLAKILRLSNPLPQDSSPLGQSLRGLLDGYVAEHADGIVADPTADAAAAAKFSTQLEKLIQLTEDYMIQEEGYTREEIADTLGISVAELNERYTTQVPVRAERFKLRQRALHVFTEALRVQRFVATLRAPGAAEDLELHNKLGALVSEVQDSCREQYECSSPELDLLCDVAKRHGSFGGRLTGAGWGGCSVHLMPAEKVGEISQAWKDEYYSKKFPDMSEAELADAIVVSKPGRGSLVYEVQGRSSV